MPQPEKNPGKGMIPHWRICELAGIPYRDDIQEVLQDYPFAAKLLKPVFDTVDDYLSKHKGSFDDLLKCFDSALNIVVKSYPDVLATAAAHIKLGSFDGAIETLLKFYKDLEVSDETLKIFAERQASLRGRFGKKTPVKYTLDKVITLGDFSLILQKTAKRILEKKLLKDFPQIAYLASESNVRASINDLKITKTIAANKILRSEDDNYSRRAVAALMLAGRRCEYTIKGLIKVMLGENPQDKSDPKDSAIEARRKQVVRLSAYMALNQTLMAHKRLFFIGISRSSLAKALSEYRDKEISEVDVYKS